MAGALEGIRVVEFANYVSGPYAGMLLGDLGAEVVKVEAPDGGYPFRGWGRVEYSPTFGSVNRNKKSIVLDLKSTQGVAAARALIRTADVVIENFRTGIGTRGKKIRDTWTTQFTAYRTKYAALADEIFPRLANLVDVRRVTGDEIEAWAKAGGPGEVTGRLRAPCGSPRFGS